MRSNTIAALRVAAFSSIGLIVACSNNGDMSGAGGADKGIGPDAVYDTAHFTVAPGSDETWCTFFQTDNDKPVDVQKFVTDQGGHHVVLYTVASYGACAGTHGTQD